MRAVYVLITTALLSWPCGAVAKRDASPRTYLRIPPRVGKLTLESDRLYDTCRLGVPDGPLGLKAMRACNANHCLLVVLERKGWCWGGSNTVAYQHWLKCRDDPNYVPGATAAEGDPVSAADIRKAEQALKNWRPQH